MNLTFTFRPTLADLAPRTPRHLWQTLRGVLQRRRRRLAAADTSRSLARLDDCTLRDLGLYRSEVASCALELYGQAAADRRARCLS